MIGVNELDPEKETGFRWLREWAGLGLNLLFPQPCVFCGGDRNGGGDYLCRLCRENIRYIRKPYCFRCGIPAEISYEYPSADFECGACRTSPFVFDRARSLGIYTGELKALIHHFKYRPQPGVIRDIFYLLSGYWEGEGVENYAGFRVVPVPLHVHKLRARQFDQAYLIARETARCLDLPLESGGLVRIKETSTQAKQSRQDRTRNIIGAFEPGPGGAMDGIRVLLVDDVMTTGATANEAAKVLKRAGAARVDVFTLARA
ncbi:MAG: amidophosphoribosyltransferase [Nitrospinae bacterium CG11_big_fil_rev_8_21_14_0_20_56_8]|nr:MAG: amidophosphoribosyltransferase [Nitrospinae bacterium CG11_big_fil_rev_8_21_14_0_20_56_8]